MTSHIAWTQGFKTEVFTKYAGQEGELVYDRFETMFKALPLCCVVDSKVLSQTLLPASNAANRAPFTPCVPSAQIFMTHGGLSDQKRVTLKSIAQIRRMRAVPVGERSRCTRGENIFMGLMWSDPTNNVRRSDDTYHVAFGVLTLTICLCSTRAPTLTTREAARLHGVSMSRRSSSSSTS